MSRYLCTTSHHRYHSADQKSVLFGDIVQQSVHPEVVSAFRQTTFIVMSVLAVVAMMFIAETCRGQAVSEASHAAAASSIANAPMCDVRSTTQKAGSPQWKNHNLSRPLQPPASGAIASEPSEPGSAKDHLRLSLPESQTKSPIPDGAFCRRPDQDSEKPSLVSPPPQSEQAPPPPVAQVAGGQLMIHANGQGFASVLHAVGTASGVDIEMPAESAVDPVFMNMGPVSAKEALIALMDGTKYNYVMMGSRSDPGIVTRLILSERSSATVGAPLVAAASEAAIASQSSVYGGQGFQEDAEAMNAASSPGQSPTNVPAVIPSSVPTGINVDKLAAQSNKTRGQVLDELQKQQLQTLDNQVAPQPQQ